MSPQKSSPPTACTRCRFTSAKTPNRLFASCPSREWMPLARPVPTRKATGHTFQPELDPCLPCELEMVMVSPDVRRRG